MASVRALGDADELQESGAERIAILVLRRHLVPVAVHGGGRRYVAVVRGVAVDVVLHAAPVPGLDRAAARDPDRRVRLLHRPRPGVDVALLVEAAVEREHLVARPALLDQVVRLEIALAQHARVLRRTRSRCPSACRPGKPAISRPPEMQSIIANSSAMRVGGL